MSVPRARRLDRIPPARKEHRPAHDIDIDSKFLARVAVGRPAEALAKVVAIRDDLDRLEVEGGDVLRHREDEGGEGEGGAAEGALVDELVLRITRQSDGETAVAPNARRACGRSALAQAT